MVTQAYDIFSRAPSNYRYFIDTGTRHTAWGSDTVYTVQSGAGPQSVNEWVNDMLRFDPLTSQSDDWQNVECSLCGIVFPADPAPPSIPTPLFYSFLGLTVVSCP